MNVKLLCFICSLTMMIFFVEANGSTTNVSSIWSGIKSIPIFQSSFWDGLGYGFGAPPSGYVYSYSVYNDTNSDIWVAQQGVISLMGACFPKAGSWVVNPVAPGDHYTKLNEEYYFEMFIKTTPNSYANNMPYLTHDDVLYQQDCIQLQEQHSTKHNYFRVYTGKDLSNGVYEYKPKAEYLGYTQMNGQKDPNALSFTSSLSSLTIKNSTASNYYVGFSSQSALTISSMTPTICSIYSLVEQDSFGLLSTFGSIKSFSPGTIGVFDVTTQKCLNLISIPTQCVSGMSYTIEIYPGSNAQAIALGWQGLISGNYDMPMNRIKDCTPISGYFWYQSAKQASSGVDLPGTLWVAARSGTDYEILAVAQPGQAVEFTIMRPAVGQKKQVFFLYLETTDQVKGQQFVQNFLAGKIGSALITQYNNQTQSMMQQGALALQPQTSTSQQATTTVMPPALINQVVTGSLQLNKGQVIDTVSGVTGYLVGTDLFLPLGIGSTPMYYLLAPSLQNQLNLPTSSVQNLFAQSSVTSAPQGMPTPILNSYKPSK